MITGVGYNANNPSFKGIVKVSRVMVDGRPSYYYKDFDSCGLQLKKILLKQSDKKTNAACFDEFRRTYHQYDREYTPPAYKVDGYTADKIAKVRNSKQTFIVTGNEAGDIADAGCNIGRKHNLERVSYYGENVGVEDAARDAYIAAKESLTPKYLSSSEHPQVVLYAERNAKGKPVLTAAMLKNDYSQTKMFVFSPKQKTAVKSEPVNSKPMVAETVNRPQQEKTLQRPSDTEKTLNSKQEEQDRDFFPHLSSRKWDIKPTTPKRKSHKKNIDNPNQLLLNL